MNSVLTGAASASLPSMPIAAISQTIKGCPSIKDVGGKSTGSAKIVIELRTSSINRLQPFWEAGLDVEAAIEVSCRTLLLAGWVSRYQMDSSDTIKVSVVLPTALIDELAVQVQLCCQSLDHVIDYALNEWLSRVH